MVKFTVDLLAVPRLFFDDFKSSKTLTSIVDSRKHYFIVCSVFLEHYSKLVVLYL